MAIQVQGYSGVIGEVDGTTYRSLRTTLRPIDPGSLGSYRCSVISGTMAAGLAAGAEIFQFRWADNSKLCVVTSVTLDGFSGSATAFTAGFANAQMWVARGWTAVGSGGTAVTLTGNNMKAKTSMPSTLVNDIRYSATAALTGGTKTLDAQPVGQYAFSIGTVVNTNYLAQPIDLFHADPGGEHPLILAFQEGFVLRATVPATGTWQWGATVTWTELTSY